MEQKENGPAPNEALSPSVSSPSAPSVDQSTHPDIFSWLLSARPKAADYPFDHHPIPGLPKKVWTAVGDHVTAREHDAVMVAPGDEYVVLRLDIRGMSKLKSRLMKNKKGFCPHMAESMKYTAQRLADEMGAFVAFTQSDEITMVVRPMPQDADATPEERAAKKHSFGGKRDKLVSLSSAMASQLFYQSYFAGETMSSETPLVVFDARLSVWPTLREAMQVVAWRAEDCARNGVSDATYHHSKALSTLNTTQKLEALQAASLLPLPRHQAYGSCFVEVWKNKRCVDRKTGVVSFNNRKELELWRGEGPCLLMLAQSVSALDEKRFVSRECQFLPPELVAAQIAASAAAASVATTADSNSSSSSAVTESAVTMPAAATEPAALQ